MPKHYPIDLGRKSDGPLPVPSSSMKGDKHYPSLYLDGVEKEMDLPTDGVMTVRFHKTSETTTNREGETTQCCCLEVKEILAVKAMKPEDDEKTPGEVLDALLAENESAAEDAGENGEE